MVIFRSERGFTFVELLLTVVVLGIGSLMVQESFLRSAGLVSRSANQLRAQVGTGERLWEGREKLVYSDFPSANNDSGEWNLGGRTFEWSLDMSSTPIGAQLYAMRVTMRWPEGTGSGEAVRETYVLRPDPSP